MYFQLQLMMNRLVILFVVAVAVVMCSVPSEGRIKYLFLSNFLVRFSNLLIIHDN